MGLPFYPIGGTFVCGAAPCEPDSTKVVPRPPSRAWYYAGSGPSTSPSVCSDGGYGPLPGDCEGGGYVPHAADANLVYPCPAIAE